MKILCRAGKQNAEKNVETQLLFYLEGELRGPFLVLNKKKSTGISVVKPDLNVKWNKSQLSDSLAEGGFQSLAPCSSNYSSIARKSLCIRLQGDIITREETKIESPNSLLNLQKQKEKNTLLPCFHKVVLNEIISVRDPYTRARAIVGGKNHNPSLWFIKWLATGLLIWENCTSFTEIYGHSACTVMLN